MATHTLLFVLPLIYKHKRKAPIEHAAFPTPAYDTLPHRIRHPRHWTTSGAALLFKGCTHCRPCCRRAVNAKILPKQIPFKSQFKTGQSLTAKGSPYFKPPSAATSHFFKNNLFDRAVSSIVGNACILHAFQAVSTPKGLQNHFNSLPFSELSRKVCSSGFSNHTRVPNFA